MEEGVNVWTDEVVEKAIGQWGRPVSPWTIYSFEQANEGKVIVDLGCGFGRFYQWLVGNRKEPVSYVGVDGSEWMVRKCKQLYGTSEEHVFFVHNALDSLDFIEEPYSCTLLCNSVLIHLPLDQQLVVLSNIKEVYPKKIVLDIESKEGVGDLARVNIEMGKPFYRTRNDLEKFKWLMEEVFSDYIIEVQEFPYGKTLKRHVFVASSI